MSGEHPFEQGPSRKCEVRQPPRPQFSALSRRHFVGFGLLSAVDLGVGRPARAQAARRTAKRAILIWLDGGPSHLETWDPKPDAAAEVRGPMGSISTCLPGIRMGECLPRLAERLDRCTLIRSLTSPLGEHNLATQYLLTGYPPSPGLEYPVQGSVISHLSDANSPLPKFVALPDHRVGGARFAPTGFLPAGSQPFETGGNPAHPDFEIESLRWFPGLSPDRLDRRLQFLRQLDEFRAQADDRGRPVGDPAWQAAVELISRPEVRRAFSVQDEPAPIRARYGATLLGQSCLLARRLVERDVRFVTVNFPGWDTHDRAVLRLKEGYTGATTPVGLIPQLDFALSGLLDDLSERGLLEETLVTVMGEFGRTPKLNTAGGRDHWPRAFGALLAGGGAPAGLVYGQTDAHGREPTDRALSPADLAATSYALMGIDPDTELTTPDGRPIRLSRDGKVIAEIAGG